MMRAGQIVAPRRVEWIELPIPEPGEGQVVVQLEAGALCGSDLCYFLGDREHPALAGLTYPLPPMYSLHELVGRVTRSRSSRFQEGDRVLAVPPLQQGLAEYFVANSAWTVPLPPGPAERLVLAQPLGTVVHACLKLGNLLGQTAVVLGQGPIGQMFTALLRRMGILRLVAVDLLDDRLTISTRMGATHTVANQGDAAARLVADLTHGVGADLVVEACGYAETLNQAVQLVRRNGTILGFGVPHALQYEFCFRDCLVKEARLVPSIGPDIQREFPLAIDLIATGIIDLGPILTHRFPLASAQEAFSLFAERREGAIKVVLLTEHADQ